MDSVPNVIKCKLSGCNYTIPIKNSKEIIKYVKNLNKRMSQSEQITVVVHCQRFYYANGSNYFMIIQIAECLDEDFYDLSNIPKNISIQLQNGIIILLPFNQEAIENLNKLFSQQNLKIITLDILTDISLLINEGVKIRYKSIIGDIENSKLKGEKIYETYPANFKQFCNCPKIIESKKFEKAFNEQYINKSQLNCLLFHAQNPFDVLNNSFWKNVANDCGLIAIAFVSTCDKFGLKYINNSAEEKIKIMKSTQSNQGPLAPYLKRRFMIDGNCLKFKQISSKTQAFNICSITNLIMMDYSTYCELVPSDKAFPLKQIKSFQKQANKFISEHNEEVPEKQKDKENLNQISGPLKNYYKDISFFVSKNKNFKNLNKTWINLAEKFNLISTKIPKKDEIYKLMIQSFKNISNYNHNFNPKINTREKNTLMANNVLMILEGIKTFLDFYTSKKYSKCKEIEKLLFLLIFNPSKDGSNMTSVYSVYSMHDSFLFGKDPYVNFKSSTGSGKTRCAPFFFGILALKDRMKRPFFIMTQPSYSIILDKYKDFKNVLKDTVTLVKDKDEMYRLYSKYSRLVREEKTKTKAFNKYFSKPIVGLFSPHILLALLSKASRHDVDMISNTRYCLDEFHERSVDTDVLVATLSSKMNEIDENFPLQILMMSATPDPRVLHCFGKVNTLELPDSQLFPIDDINVEVDTKSKVNGEVLRQTFGVIKRFTDESVEKGHILIFTSGNARIKDIQNGINDQCESQCKNDKYIIKVIKDFESMVKDTSVKQFYFKLNKFIKKSEKYCPKNKKMLFILPIRYHSSVSNEQKEIGRNPIPGHDNVIKIVIATNAIESSITITNLAAVVDSCLFNRPFYDKDKGLTTLIEEPISVKSQTQRRGRVGRVRPGIYIQIRITGFELTDLLPPEIQTTDITQNILNLRTIGYKLEKIKNLPDPVDKSDMTKYITELETFGALEKGTHNLTPLGKLLGNFNSISPFIVSAILKTSGYTIENDNDENADDEKNKIIIIRSLLGFLISLLFNDPNLVINSYSYKLQENFDPESDITTILMTFLSLMQNSRKRIKDLSDEYGFNQKSISTIIGQIMQTAEQLPYFEIQKKKQMKKREEEEAEEDKKDEAIEEVVQDDAEDANDGIIDDVENADDGNDGDENEESQEKIVEVEVEEDVKEEEEEIKKKKNSEKKKKKNFDQNILSYKTIFYHLYKYANELRSQKQLNDFITTLIHEIGKNKPEWRKCRIVHFYSVEQVASNPSIIYTGDKSLIFEGESDSKIYMRMRPGSFGLDFPFTGYILSISHENNVRMNFGSIIHYDQSLPNSNSIQHPISIQGSITLNNIFTEMLIEGYLSEENESFQKLCRGKSVGKDDGNALFYRSQGIKINPENPKDKQNCTLFSYIPLNAQSDRTFQNAIKVAEKLIPFTPSTLLIPDNILKCFVSIRGIGSDKIDSSVHMFNTNNYFAYQINRDSLNYALKNIDKLESPIEQITFAMTGEFLSFPLSSTDEEENEAKDKITFPQINQKCTSVFSSDKFFYSHLVLVSTTKIQPIGNIKELTWTRSGISGEFSSDDYIAHAANSISRELLSIKKSGTCFIFSLPSPKINVNGTIPSLLGGATMHFHQAGLFRQQERRPLGEILDLYAMNYIKNTQLLQPLNQIFKSFRYEGSNMYNDVQAPSVKDLEFHRKKQISSDIDSIKSQIDSQKSHKERLKSSINSYNKSTVLSQIKSINTTIDNLFSRMNQLKAELKQPQISAFVYTPRLTALTQLEQTHVRNLGPGCICIDTYHQNPNEIKLKAMNLIMQYYPNVSVEEISSFQVTVKHRQYSGLSKEQFTSLVQSVANQFGAVISRVGKYNDVKSQIIKGTISVNMYTCEFTLPFAGMIKQAFLEGTHNKILRIPRSVVDPYLINDKKVISVLKSYFEKHKLNIKKNGIQWFGDEKVVEKALILLNEDKPKIPYTEYRIPSDVNLLVVDKRLHSRRQDKWYLNKRSRALFVPASVSEQVVTKFINKLTPGNNSYEHEQDENDDVEIEKILGDYMFCEEDAELSRNFINIFMEDGSVVQRNYCVSCVNDSFGYNLRKMFNTSQNEILMDEVIRDDEFLSPIQLMTVDASGKDGKHDIFPMISFGQVFWNFISEPKISGQAKAWVTITAIKAIRKSQFFTFCPEHPNVLIPKPSKDQSIKCLIPECSFFLCGNCGNWHKPGKCEKKTTIPPGYRVCPYCGEAVEKSMACNYLACRCGKAFCYYCGLGLSEGKHSVGEHGSCYNHPPDYRKYCLHENIPESELEQFYQQYPQWRPDFQH